MSWPAAPERCAVQADLRGDEMLGTAFPAARLLLVEEPFPWGREGLRTSRFDRRVALELEARGREVGVRVQAIRRVRARSTPATPTDAQRRWFSVDTRTRSRQIRAGEFGADAELLDLPLDGSAGTPETGPLFLVCTHGKHDPCCGQRGRPVASALNRLAPGRVWQASHLGGCRFSPTVLTLPAGIMYGRVGVPGAAEIAAATAAGAIVGVSLRGQIGLAPAAQAAVGYAHRRLGLAGIADVFVTGVRTEDPTRVEVRLDTARGPHRVLVARERVDAVGLTCGAPGPSWFVAHRLVEIAPLPRPAVDDAAGPAGG